LVDTYECEWAGVVRDDEKRAQFRHFAGDVRMDDAPRLVAERGQVRPDQRPRRDPLQDAGVRRLPLLRSQWVRVASVRDVPVDGGVAVRHGSTQIALFHVAATGAWYATQNLCPHKREMVLARGIVGDQAGVPKVACPLHKKTFDLQSGRCLSGEELEIATFPVRVEGDDVLVELPPVDELAKVACRDGAGSPPRAQTGISP
jgi:nitrite reductase (NADH) large subunit